MKWLLAKDIESELRQSICECKSIRWAVAWASQSNPIHALLVQHQEKIEQLTVGIHFYQTDPDFIETFIRHDAVRFVMNPSGVFHPKVYLFMLDDSTWNCVVGSANLTIGGLSTNSELSLRISSRDEGANELIRPLLKILDDFHLLGKQLDLQQLATYRQLHVRQLAKLQSVSGIYDTATEKKRSKRSPLDAKVFTDDWQSYLASIKADPYRSVDIRLAVLDEARKFFQGFQSFREMPVDARRGIAGFSENATPDWLYFGSMKGHGYFKEAILKNSGFISEALDSIPLDGPIRRNDFEDFASLFTQAFRNPGVATASRLLALKRPDYFICLAKKNEARLCKDFGIPQKVSLDEYWDKIAARIIDSNWWNSERPSHSFDRKIWHGRAALLDVRYFEEI